MRSRKGSVCAVAVGTGAQRMILATYAQSANRRYAIVFCRIRLFLILKALFCSSGLGISRCCLFVFGQSDAILQAYIKCLRDLPQEDTSGLHGQESTACHQILEFALS